MTCRAAGNQLEGAEEERERWEKEKQFLPTLGDGMSPLPQRGLTRDLAKALTDSHQEAASANGTHIK